MSRDRSHGSTLNREAILHALKTLSDEPGGVGVTGEVCLFGGTVMVLAYSARLATEHFDQTRRLAVRTERKSLSTLP